MQYTTSYREKIIKRIIELHAEGLGKVGMLPIMVDEGFLTPDGQNPINISTINNNIALLLKSGQIEKRNTGNSTKVYGELADESGEVVGVVSNLDELIDEVIEPVEVEYEYVDVEETDEDEPELDDIEIDLPQIVIDCLISEEMSNTQKIGMVRGYYDL